MRLWCGLRHEARCHMHLRSEDGFTLFELLIVLVILPIVLAGIVVALIGILQNESTTFSRTSDTADAQISSANFIRDVQNASLITTGSAPGSIPCSNDAGTYPPAGSTPLLGLQWSDATSRTISDAYVNHNFTLTSGIPSSPGQALFTQADVGALVTGTGNGAPYIQTNTYIIAPVTSKTVALTLKTNPPPAGPVSVVISSTSNFEATYWMVPSGSSAQLVRMFCSTSAQGNSFISEEVLAHDLPASQGLATVTCGPNWSSAADLPASDCTSGYLANHSVPTAGITDVSIASDEPGSTYNFNLSATPRSTNPNSQGLSTNAGASDATALLVTGSGPSLTVPGSLTVNGELTFTQAASVSGSGNLTVNPGPIQEFSCTTTGGCNKVTSQFTGSCNCGGTAANLSYRISPPTITPPLTSITPVGSCTTSGSNTDCQPGYYANAVSVSGNITFENGNYDFAKSVSISPGTSSTPSVNFGSGQYTFESGLNVGASMSVTGYGVFFYQLGGSLAMGAGDTIISSAPSSGPYVGLLIYQPSTNGLPMTLDSSAAPIVNTYDGAVEAPSASVTLGSSNDQFKVDSLVANTLTLGSSAVIVVLGPN